MAIVGRQRPVWRRWSRRRTPTGWLASRPTCGTPTCTPPSTRRSRVRQARHPRPQRRRLGLPAPTHPAHGPAERRGIRRALRDQRQGLPAGRRGCLARAGQDPRQHRHDAVQRLVLRQRRRPRVHRRQARLPGADAGARLRARAPGPGQRCRPRRNEHRPPRTGVDRAGGSLDRRLVREARRPAECRSRCTTLIDPADFTGPYVLLASREQSGTITGQAISADGGIGVRGFGTPAGGDHLLDLVTRRAGQVLRHDRRFNPAPPCSATPATSLTTSNQLRGRRPTYRSSTSAPPASPRCSPTEAR